MTFYFMGGEIGAFTPSDSTTFETTNVTNFDPSFARCGLSCGTGAPSQYGKSAAFTAPDTFYAHGDIIRGTTDSASATAIECVAGSTPLFRVLSTNATLQMQAWISSAWTNVGASVSYTGSALQTVDLYIAGNSATGTAKLYLSGTLRVTASSVNLSAVTGITEVRSYGIDSAASHRISQFIISDEPTIGMKVATFHMTGAGATGDWTGDFTGIDEITYSDADFIYSGTNGQIELFTATGPSLTGYVVRAVGVYARAKCGAGGPQNLQFALRVSGTNYFSGSNALDVGYGAFGHIWDTNPDTTGDWLTSQIATIQPGVKAIT